MVYTVERWKRQLQLGNIRLSYDLSLLDKFENFSASTKNHILRITQELLGNAVKHANASQLELVFSENKSALWVKISDDGKGGDFLGLDNLKTVRDRVTLLGGELKIESKPAKGTTIVFKVPFTEM